MIFALTVRYAALTVSSYCLHTALQYALWTRSRTYHHHRGHIGLHLRIYCIQMRSYCTMSTLWARWQHPGRLNSVSCAHTAIFMQYFFKRSYCAQVAHIALITMKCSHTAAILRYFRTHIELTALIMRFYSL